MVSIAAAPEADRVRLNVQDTGVGIPEGKLEDIFQPFVQIETSTIRAGRGTGLGLAISRELARAMGGDLTVESTRGKGSTFILSLPRANSAS
jgi:signal transduction histidine kinase